ncbi:MAG: hypothetical protein VW495_14430, partial [Rhodobiaceae bacterium]
PAITIVLLRVFIVVFLLVEVARGGVTPVHWPAVGGRAQRTGATSCSRRRKRHKAGMVMMILGFLVAAPATFSAAGSV